MKAIEQSFHVVVFTVFYVQGQGCSNYIWSFRITNRQEIIVKMFTSKSHDRLVNLKSVDETLVCI